MAWRADQIYIPVTPAILDYFRHKPEFGDGLFIVKDWLKGIRSESSRESFLKNPKLGHIFPAEGVLVIKPVIYSTGYDKDRDTDPFWANYKSGGREKWAFLPDLKPSFSLPASFDLPHNKLPLLAFLEKVYEEFKVPICYYYSEMWGGDIECEYAVSLDNGVHFYMYDVRQRCDAKFDANGKQERIKMPVLKAGLGHIGLHIHNSFFALHEGSFNWKDCYLQPQNDV